MRVLVCKCDQQHYNKIRLYLLIGATADILEAIYNLKSCIKSRKDIKILNILQKYQNSHLSYKHIYMILTIDAITI